MANLEIGVATYSASLQLLFDKLYSPALRHFGLMFNVEDKLESLQRTVVGIDSLVIRAEMLHVRDPVLDIWLRDLKDVAWDAEDLIDDFAIMVNDKDGENQNRYNIIKKVEVMKKRYDIGMKIDKIQNRLETIARERSGLGLAHPPPQPQIQMMESRATSSLPMPSEMDVFGRDDDRKYIVRLLLDPSVDVIGTFRLPVIPIVGMGGLGKTTLARAVYNEPDVKNHFKDLRIWVYVSEDLNVRRITEEIFEAACGKKPSSIGSWNILQDELRNELSKKMFLLVLDDVWTENYEVWDRLFAPLNSGKEGSKVVITTRSMKIANNIGTVQRPLSLGGLPEPDCWNLFKARAFVKSSCDAHPGLERIGRKIVKRLGGVPLAVNTIGGLCSSNLDEGKWTAILKSEIWTLPQQENDIMPVLRLSYQQMPTHLKLCFKFCSIFPKGHDLEKEELVLLWMAHGFVQPRPQERRPIEDIGGEYFDDLLCRSFFQLNDPNYPDVFLMHDLMHDLAQSISAEECVIINDHNIKQKIPEKVRHLSLHLDSSFEFEDFYKLKGLRTLVYIQKRTSGFTFSHVPRELFENLKYLRVLDLSGSGIVELPDSIGLLKHLRHLDLSCTHIRSLPIEVGDLCNLQTLDLRYCYAQNALPESMNKLTNFRSIYGYAQCLLSKLVGIGNMKSLQKLTYFKVSRENGRKVGELKELTELRGELVISQLENVISEAEADEASLTNKQYLRRLVLQWGAGDQRENGSADEKILERLKPHPNLKALEIKCNDGVNFPSWLADQYLSNLEQLTLENCRRWKVLPLLGQLSSLKKLTIEGMEGVVLQNLTALEDLEISNCEELSTLGIQDLNSLKSLDIWNCPKLTSLTDNREGLQSFIPLKTIKIWDCASLESLPAGLHHLSSLKELQIEYCPQFQGFFSDLHALEELTISGCEDLSTLGIQALNSLEKLYVKSCPKLTSLTDNREGLQSFIPLKTIRIFNCASFGRLPAGLHHLSSLKELEIKNCPQFQGFFSDLHALGLMISNCEELSTLGIQALNSLKYLYVTNCPKLTSLTDNREGLQSFIPLKTIRIFNCASFGRLPAGLHHLSSLKELEIKNCPQFQGFFSDLHALEDLKISNCEELSTLGIQALNSLENLYVTNCPKLTSLTDNREGLQNFIPLKTIEICDCASLERLPSGLNHLSSLYKLVIKNCPQIQRSYPDLPASLQIFDINL